MPAWPTRRSASDCCGAPCLPEPGPKLLFDENLAARLARALAAPYPGSAHVSALGLTGAPDRTIWGAAAVGGFVLVTKDEDFHRLSVLKGFPPQVLWIRLGNCTTRDVIVLLEDRLGDVLAFCADQDAGFLALP